MTCRRVAAPAGGFAHAGAGRRSHLQSQGQGDGLLVVEQQGRQMGARIG